MAYKVIMAAAAAAAVLILSSILLPSDAKSMCPLFRSQVPDCHGDAKRCLARCQDDGYVGGFCTSQQICMCAQCLSADDFNMQVGQGPSPQPAAPEPTRGA